MKNYLVFLIAMICLVFTLGQNITVYAKKTDKNSTEKKATSADKKKEDDSQEILTIDNCPDLASVLSNTADVDDSYTDFSTKYRDKTIQFDGRIDYLVNHDNYDTRYDILVSAGDYDPDSQIGPTFKFENVNAYNLGLESLFLENEIAVGDNVRITATVGEYNDDTGIFFLMPVKIEQR